MNLTRRERSIRVDLQTAAFVLSALGVIVALVAGTITYYNARTNLPAEAPNRFDDFVFLTMDKDGLFKFVRTDHPTSVYGKEVANPNTILWEGYTLAVHEPYDQLTVFRMVVSGHPQGLCHYFWWSEDQEGNRLKFQDGGHVQAALVPNRSPNAGLRDPNDEAAISGWQTTNQAAEQFAQIVRKLGYTHVEITKKEDGELLMFHPGSGRKVVSQDGRYAFVPAQ